MNESWKICLALYQLKMWAVNKRRLFCCSFFRPIRVILTMPQESSVSEAASNADVAVSDVNQDLIHLDDAGTAQIVENVDISADGTDVAFSSADFSIYKRC